MKRLFILATLILQGGGQLVSVSIQNPSFESASSPAGNIECGLSWWHADNWQFSQGVEVFQPNNPNTCGIPAPPDGNKFLFVGNGGIAYQTLSTTPAHWQTSNGTPVGGSSWDGIYNLTFWVTNYYPGYPGYAVVKVTYGSQELCDAEFWVIHSLTQVTTPCPSPKHLLYQSEPGGGPGQGDQHFVISFSTQAGWSLLFDMPSQNALTFTSSN